jgi:hypothetical protein
LEVLGEDFEFFLVEFFVLGDDLGDDFEFFLVDFLVLGEVLGEDLGEDLLILAMVTGLNLVGVTGELCGVAGILGDRLCCLDLSNAFSAYIL